MVIPASDLTPILGESPSFLAMLEHVSEVAPMSKPSLVIGERGTGKELIATRLHFLSRRWQQPLVKLNCAVLTETLLESELFGHEEGAFTGAVRTHIGRFERADSGTLFLDELATIPLRMQEKILRVIEYGEFERVGGSETIQVDVRILGATNTDLPGLARRGEFRADLLDRLAFDVITVPPLRARQEDILPLAHHFAINMTSELGRSYFPGFSSRAASTLLTHKWPGNVRELKNTVERSVYRAPERGKPIARIDFDPFASPYRISSEAGPRPTEHPSAPAALIRASSLPVDLKQVTAELEIELVRRAMEQARYNQRNAADLLGLTYNQLRGALKKYDLVREFRRQGQRS